MMDSAANDGAGVPGTPVEYSRQPTGGRLRCVFHPHGVTIFDEPNRFGGERRPNRRTIVVLISNGRLTITKPSDTQAAPYRFLKDRHIQRMLVIPPRLFGWLGSSCLRIWVSDMHIDLFAGTTMSELEWVDQTIRFELHKHGERKAAAGRLGPESA